MRSLLCFAVGRNSVHRATAWALGRCRARGQCIISMRHPGPLIQVNGILRRKDSPDVVGGSVQDQCDACVKRWR
jgi:hypothetical protein